MSFIGPIITFIALLSATGAPAMGAETDFAVWLDEFRTEAIAAGISPKTVEAALADMTGPLPNVIELDRTQPESTQTLADYVADRVNEKRIVNGYRMLDRYPTWLGRVERKYGVRSRFVVALWGIESSYGEHAGGYPVIHSLVTLAHDGRRSAYFRRELFDALRILDAGHVPLKDMKGSWAGAMGQCQFMPSSFLRYAVDADGDGRIDIWRSIPDILASIANYLARVGWEDGLTWGRPVLLPEGFDVDLAGLETKLPISRWQDLGVRRLSGKALPRRDLDASLIFPEGPGGPAYLVYDNFRALLAWNQSKAFAVAVGTLADRLAAQQEKGKPGAAKGKPSSRR